MLNHDSFIQIFGQENTDSATAAFTSMLANPSMTFSNTYFGQIAVKLADGVRNKDNSPATVYPYYGLPQNLSELLGLIDFAYKRNRYDELEALGIPAAAYIGKLLPNQAYTTKSGFYVQERQVQLKQLIGALHYIVANCPKVAEQLTEEDLKVLKTTEVFERIMEERKEHQRIQQDKDDSANRSRNAILAWAKQQEEQQQQQSEQQEEDMQ